MSETNTPEHTRGPWRLETVRTQVGICHKIGPFPHPRKGVTSACIYDDGALWLHDGIKGVSEELRANARLISKAWLLPELVEALRDLENASQIRTYLPLRERSSFDAIWTAAKEALHHYDEADS